MLKEDKVTVNNNRGISVLELLVASGISALVVVVASVPIINQVKMQKKVESYFWLSQTRAEIVASLKKKAVLDAAIVSNLNPSLACLKPKVTGAGNSLNCKDQGGSINQLLSPGGTVLIGNTSATAGFTETGKPCDSFSASSVDCPFRFEVKWLPICPATGTCFNPDVKFQGTVIVADKLKARINPDHYQFQWILPTSEHSDTVCNTSGIGSGTSGNCKLKIETTCPAGKYVVGFDKNGSPNCQPVVAERCRDAEVLQGFGSSGMILCGGVCRNL